MKALSAFPFWVRLPKARGRYSVPEGMPHGTPLRCLDCQRYVHRSQLAAALGDEPALRHVTCGGRIVVEAMGS